MVTKLQLQGDKFVLVLDAATLQDLKIDLDTPLNVTARAGQLVVSPQQSEDFETVLEKVNTRYADTFRRLAE